MWCDKIVSGTSDKTVANSIDVLKVLHSNLFTKEDPKARGKLSITTLDASELLRKSLNRCITILTNSKESFNVIDFNFWAETLLSNFFTIIRRTRTDAIQTQAGDYSANC